MTRAAVWVRVAKDRTETSRQAAALQAEARARGWTVSVLYRTNPSSWRAGHEAALQRLRRDIRDGRFEALVVWTVAYLSMDGQDGREIARSLEGMGVTVVGLREPATDSGSVVSAETPTTGGG